MEFKRILVPLDGSPLAETALTEAVDLAKRTGASLVLVRAAEAHTLTGDPTDAQVTVVREAEEYLAAVKARIAVEGLARVETSVWYGSAADAIVEAAVFRNTDLIVMSTHGRTGLGRLVLGSVAESVLRATKTPILLLRPHGAPVATPAARGAKELAGA